MCLIIDIDYHPDKTPLIANDDIEVFKVIIDDNMSPFRNFQYRANKEYAVPKFSMHFGEINQGLHALRTLKAVEPYYKIFAPEHKVKVTKFIIPKGAQYFIGQNDDIVSDKIKSLDLKPISLKK